MDKQARRAATALMTRCATSGCNNIAGRDQLTGRNQEYCGSCRRDAEPDEVEVLAERVDTLEREVSQLRATCAALEQLISTPAPPSPWPAGGS